MICQDADCNQDREMKMIVIKRGVDGVPTVWCDPCIASIIAALNDGGIKTVASCCGHRQQLGRIALADGRELVIHPNSTSSG